MTNHLDERKEAFRIIFNFYAVSLIQYNKYNMIVCLTEFLKNPSKSIDSALQELKERLYDSEYIYTNSGIFNFFSNLFYQNLENEDETGFIKNLTILVNATFLGGGFLRQLTYFLAKRYNLEKQVEMMISEEYTIKLEAAISINDLKERENKFFEIYEEIYLAGDTSQAIGVTIQ